VPEVGEPTWGPVSKSVSESLNYLNVTVAMNEGGRSCRTTQLRLNRSSQHRVVDLIVDSHVMLQPASASQASCGADC
jgi:hypothetical protein